MLGWNCFLAKSVFANDPTTLPLLHSSDIVYLGSFKIPRPVLGSDSVSFDYGGMGLAISANGKNLYVAGHVYYQTLGEIAIPNSFGDTATLVKAPVGIPGSIGGSCGSSIEISGALVFNNRLIVQKRCYNDNEGDIGYTHAAGTLDLNEFTPFSRLANLPYKQYASGYMGIIPLEWQNLLGGPAFTGNGIMGISSQCSHGPTFYVFNPNDVGKTSLIPSIPLMYFPYGNELSNPKIANDLFSESDQSNAGMIFPSGTRSVLFVNRHGHGNPTYNVDDGCGGKNGYGAKPYRRQITAFDANDLLAVKNGTKLPYAIRPYEWWVVPGPTDSCAGFTYSGLAYDPITRKVYMALGYNDNPVIHVWQVKDPTTRIKTVHPLLESGIHLVCTVFNTHGQEVAKIQGLQGNESDILELAKVEKTLPKGIYLYRLKGKGISFTIKKTLMK